MTRPLTPADILPAHLAARIRVTPEGHWHYRGCHTSRGRACVAAGGRNQLLYHVTGTAVHGPRPAGCEWSHHCGDRACVHPWHGAWESGAVNRARRWAHEAARRRTVAAVCWAVVLAPAA